MAERYPNLKRFVAEQREAADRAYAERHKGAIFKENTQRPQSQVDREDKEFKRNFKEGYDQAKRNAKEREEAHVHHVKDGKPVKNKSWSFNLPFSSKFAKSKVQSRQVIKSSQPTIRI